MTRYLSGVSGYFGCTWNQNGNAMSSAREYQNMTQLLLERNNDCRKSRLHSLFVHTHEKDAHDLCESYSPSIIRKARALTVPPLQDIYEDTIFYSSKWVSPTLTRKERRVRLQNHPTNKDLHNNKSSMEDINNNNNNNTAHALKTTETFSTRFSSPQQKRSNFCRHVLSALSEDKITRSFDESTLEDDEEDAGEVKPRMNMTGVHSFRRPRSWSH